VTCPFCGRAFRRRCACGGAWLDEAELAGLLAELDVPWQPRDGAPRPCPECAAPMGMVALEGIALDRCDRHGVWFDPSELVLVLQHAEHADADQPIPGAEGTISTAVAADDAVMFDGERAGLDDTFLRGHSALRFEGRAARALLRIAELLGNQD
jgi:Zn-finger nucleic acid-binding protein